MSKFDNEFENFMEIPRDKYFSLVYKPNDIITPYGKLKIINADFTASGLPSPYVEHNIEKNVYTHYANTHSNAHNGIMMKNMIENVKQNIKKHMNICNDYKIIFTGSGATAAANLLVNLIDYNAYDRVHIFLTLYEHYSNYLPWIEMSKKHTNVKVHYIPFKVSKKYSEVIDMNWFENTVHEINSITNTNTLILCSVTACSNVNGAVTDLPKIKNILSLNIINSHIKYYLFADYACSAPYVNIDGSILDGFFFSPHKFIGGVATPGILIGRQCVFEKKVPFCPGGGCVKNVHHDVITYSDNIETKESAGSMNIVGILKLEYILQIKDKFQDVINNNEKVLHNIIRLKINEFQKKYSNFKTVLYNNEERHLPIMSFSINKLHYNYIVVLLNDIFGIQSRGGISCCGKLGEYMDETYDIKGWCRISFHWTMTKMDINKIFTSIEYVINKGHMYSYLYTYDKQLNLFNFIGKGEY